MIRVLFIFSNPTESARLSLDREDKAIMSLSKQYSHSVFLERQHASDIEDIHRLISTNIYDIIHFSGHGDKHGIILEKCGSPGKQEWYSAMQIVHLLDLAPKPPTVALFLCCFSAEYAETLCKAAPFVITTGETVYDSECIQFVIGFYEKFFESQSVTSSFTHAINLFSRKNLYRDVFRLFRRELLIKSDSMFIECKPRIDRDPIIINLDPVAGKLDNLGATQEEILHLISRPIGSLLFGSFSWKNSADVVICKDLVRLGPGVSDKHWQLWAAFTSVYNDLAACAYRNIESPSDPSRKDVLADAILVFDHHIGKYLIPNKDVFGRLGFEHILPYIAFAEAECEQTADQFRMKRYTRVVSALESALTHYHEIVTALQPP